MATLTANEGYWTAVLAESTEIARANAAAALFASGTKLKFYDSANNLLRTITADAATREALATGYYPIALGAFTDAATGTGTPSLLVVTTSADVEIVRMTAGVNSGQFQIPSAFASGVALQPGAFRFRYPAATAPATGKRWHPGHYFYASNDYVHDISFVESRRNKVRYNEHFAGYYMLMYWDQVESTQGTYDFGPVLSMLDTAQADGKMVWIRIEDRSFHGYSRGLACPSYIHSGGGLYEYGGYLVSPKFWVPWVSEAVNSMISALMEAVDDHPALQGVATEECSMAGSWLQPGYTWQAQNAHVLAQCAAGSAGAVKSLWHQNMGWSNESMEDMIEHYRMTDAVVRTYKAGLSPTDLRIHPTPYGTYTDTPYGAYITTRYAGEAFFAPCVEYHTYISSGLTAQALLDYGVDTLGVQFIGWATTDYDAAWAFTSDDAIAEVTRQQGRINSARPSIVPV